MSNQAVVITPQAVAKMPEVGHAFTLYVALSFMSQRTGCRTVEVRQSELAEATGLTVLTTMRHADKLVEHGLITMVRRTKFGKSHEYTLVEEYMPDAILEKLPS